MVQEIVHTHSICKKQNKTKRVPLSLIVLLFVTCLVESVTEEEEEEKKEDDRDTESSKDKAVSWSHTLVSSHTHTHNTQAFNKHKIA